MMANLTARFLGDPAGWDAVALQLWSVQNLWGGYIIDVVGMGMATVRRVGPGAHREQHYEFALDRETVTLAQVHAQPEAALLYPHGTLMATTTMTGTTILIARYQNYGCSYRNCHTFIGYDSPRVNGGYVSRLFATGDSLSQVLAWYRREMARRGWTLGAPRHSRDMDLTRFIRVGQLPDSCQPDDFVLYTGQPQAVSTVAGKPPRGLSRRQTLFATRYTLYPDDAAQVLSNYCPLGALHQWHDAMPSNNS